jgi:hypothetical protein
LALPTAKEANMSTSEQNQLFRATWEAYDQAFKLFEERMKFFFSNGQKTDPVLRELAADKERAHKAFLEAGKHILHG